MIDRKKCLKRHDELNMKGIVNLSEEEQDELIELDVIVKRE